MAHQRDRETLVGQPVRLVLYAAIGLAVLRLRPRDVYWGLVAVLYAGTVWQVLLGGYSLATGSHQTGAYALSTGGTRVLSLGAGMYLAGALLIALLNVGFDQGRRRWLHLAVAGLALVAEALTFGRTQHMSPWRCSFRSSCCRCATRGRSFFASGLSGSGSPSSPSPLSR